MTAPIVPAPCACPAQDRPPRPCVRCRLIAQLDRAGYCRLCQRDSAGLPTWYDAPEAKKGAPALRPVAACPACAGAAGTGVGMHRERSGQDGAARNDARRLPASGRPLARRPARNVIEHDL